jgi:hypothetical protein
MKLPPYVCSTCVRTFTRRSSASRHNFNIHFGQGTIVKTLEYIIEKCGSPYLPASFSIGNRNSSNQSRLSFNSRNKSNISDAAGRRFFLNDKKLSNSNPYNSAFRSTKAFEGKKFFHAPSTLDYRTDHTMSQSFASKLAEVKKLFLKYVGPSAALDAHMNCLASFTSIPEHRAELDKYLAWLRSYFRYFDDLTQLAN